MSTREAFEALMAAQGYETPAALYRDGTYRSAEYAAGWAIWQAVVPGLMADRSRLDSGCILLHERDEFGEPYTREIRGLDLRKAIDQAIEAQGDVERIIE